MKPGKTVWQADPEQRWPRELILEQEWTKQHNYAHVIDKRDGAHCLVRSPQVYPTLAAALRAIKKRLKTVMRLLKEKQSIWASYEQELNKRLKKELQKGALSRKGNAKCKQKA